MNTQIIHIIIYWSSYHHNESAFTNILHLIVIIQFFLFSCYGRRALNDMKLVAYDVWQVFLTFHDRRTVWEWEKESGALIRTFYCCALFTYKKYSVVMKILYLFFYLFRRFIEEEQIHEPKLLLVVGCLGLLVNLIGLVLLFGKNIRRKWIGRFTLKLKFKFKSLSMCRTRRTWSFTWRPHPIK